MRVTVSQVKRSVVCVMAALSQMSVFAQGATIDFSSAVGTGLNTTDIVLENVRLLVPTPNPFSPGTTTTTTTLYNVQFRFNPSNLHFEPIGLTDLQSQSCAAATVTVTNAVLGQNSPISGATVTIGRQTVTTNSQGVATFTGLPSGPVNISTVASSFVVTNQAATLSCTTPNAVSVSLSPSSGTGSLTAGSFRVITTWGENPRDLDSHMTGPDSATGRWHVYFSSKTAGDMCGLDVDDTTSFGPETITCPRAGVSSLRPGIYRYSIHHYAGTGNIGTSSANVRLELGNGQSYSYTPPTGLAYTGSGNVWTVFELTVNANGTVSVAPVNTLDASVSSSSVRGVAPTTMGQPENLLLFQNLEIGRAHV